MATRFVQKRHTDVIAEINRRKTIHNDGTNSKPESIKHGTVVTHQKERKIEQIFHAGLCPRTTFR